MFFEVSDLPVILVFSVSYIVVWISGNLNLFFISSGSVLALNVFFLILEGEGKGREKEREGTCV